MAQSIKEQILISRGTKIQPFRRDIRNDLAEKIVKSLKTGEIDEFRKSLGFNVLDVFNGKQ